MAHCVVFREAFEFSIDPAQFCQAANQNHEPLLYSASHTVVSEHFPVEMWSLKLLMHHCRHEYACNGIPFDAFSTCELTPRLPSFPLSFKTDSLQNAELLFLQRYHLAGP